MVCGKKMITIAMENISDFALFTKCVTSTHFVPTATKEGKPFEVKPKQF